MLILLVMQVCRVKPVTRRRQPAVEIAGSIALVRFHNNSKQRVEMEKLIVLGVGRSVVFVLKLFTRGDVPVGYYQVVLSYSSRSVTCRKILQLFARSLVFSTIQSQDFSSF